jgi:hypothetical protein
VMNRWLKSRLVSEYVLRSDQILKALEANLSRRRYEEVRRSTAK